MERLPVLVWVNVPSEPAWAAGRRWSWGSLLFCTLPLQLPVEAGGAGALHGVLEELVSRRSGWCNCENRKRSEIGSLRDAPPATGSTSETGVRFYCLRCCSVRIQHVVNSHWHVYAGGSGNCRSGEGGTHDTEVFKTTEKSGRLRGITWTPSQVIPPIVFPINSLILTSFCQIPGNGKHLLEVSWLP